MSRKIPPGSASGTSRLLHLLVFQLRCSHHFSWLPVTHQTVFKQTEEQNVTFIFPFISLTSALLTFSSRGFTQVQLCSTNTSRLVFYLVWVSEWARFPQLFLPGVTVQTRDTGVWNRHCQHCGDIGRRGVVVVIFAIVSNSVLRGVGPEWGGTAAMLCHGALPILVRLTSD